MQVFDYIIVGAGSAGCVLANRLTERPHIRVLLVEAGGSDAHPWLHIPIGFGRLFGNPKYYWSYPTESEPELNGRAATVVMGKVLGGSSAVNGLVYVRGQREDFDHWRQLGNFGWDFASVLPYFRKMEDWAGGPDEFRGAGGPLCVSEPPQAHELCDAFIAAAGQAGMAANRDCNGARQEGAGYIQTTSRRGRRWSTATAYLRPARNRPNLVVVTNALTHRVLFEGSKAIGVEYSQASQRLTARAGREVVLSAGAIASAQLLQLSGVGPAALLQANGVKVVMDLPGVGQNLRDHFGARIAFRCTKPFTLNDRAASLTGRLSMAAQYALTRSGPMAVGAGYAGAFFRTDERLASPDAQTVLLMFSAPPGSMQLHRFSGFTFSTYQLRPESHGAVEIQGPRVCDAPRVRFNYLSTELDRKTIVHALHKLREVVQQPAFKPYVAGAVGLDLDRASDADLLDFIRGTGGSAMHASCTCRMGADDKAVVDARLRVRKVDRLRVIDASVMPTLVSGNTNAATIMIAEKGADLLIDDMV
jgi:choline dehydrogenase